jgi:hypothetical protein
MPKVPLWYVFAALGLVGVGGVGGTGITLSAADPDPAHVAMEMHMADEYPELKEAVERLEEGQQQLAESQRIDSNNLWLICRSNGLEDCERPR